MAGYIEPVWQGARKEGAMKKIIATILSLVMLTLASCEGVYTPPTTPSTEPCPPHVDSDVSGVCDKCGAIIQINPTPGTPGDSGEEFTVKLVYNGADFLPNATESIFVQWTDGYSYYTAPIENGVARVRGLDGDYRVTLTSVPDGYAYNPNIYVATNDAKDISIELQKITKIRGATNSSGSDLYDCFKVSGTGVYSVEIKRSSQVVYYEFTPTRSGTYTIESWVDITDNTVNPSIDVYTGHSQYKNYSYTQDDGGAASTYTKNFSYDIEIGESFIGNCFTIGVKVSQISGKYPQTINVAIKRNGGFDVPATEYEMVIPTEIFERTPEYDSSRYEYVEAYAEIGGIKFYDGARFGYNAERGCYCLYNEESGLYDGPILYAKINAPTIYVDRSLAGIEQDNNVLRISATEDYSLFVKGWDAIVDEWDIWLESLSEDQFNYYASNLQAQGYAVFCNSDGVYKVTEELREFLQKFSTSQLYFRDGEGWVESYDVYAAEEDQWLFACGYYVEK